MQVGMIGLGRVGANLARRLMRGGQALWERFSSRGGVDFQDRLLSALRFELGGHAEEGAEE